MPLSSVWAKGDTRPDLPTGQPGDPGGVDVCALLTCMLGQDGVRQLLKRREIDPDQVSGCVERACR